MTPFTSRTRLILQHRPSAHLLAAAVITYIVIATSAMATVTTVQAAPSSPAGDTVQRSDRVSDVGENSRPIWRPGPPFLPPNMVVSPFLLEATDVQAMVTGPVAHVVATQTWNNPNGSPVDGLYIFPLPENAAVTDLSLRVGNRHITGRMLRREEARAVYETARAEGRIAGLLDQERPNIFAQQVANIMPGVTVDVVLSFDHEITCADGSCEYVFPTVVGPRFIPASQASPGRIAPPVVNEGAHTLQRLTLAVDIDAGVTVRDVT